MNILLYLYKRVYDLLLLLSSNRVSGCLLGKDVRFSRRDDWYSSTLNLLFLYGLTVKKCEILQGSTFSVVDFYVFYESYRMWESGRRVRIPVGRKK